MERALSLERTKPICTGVGVQGSGFSGLTPDPPALGLLRQTNPISVGAF